MVTRNPFSRRGFLAASAASAELIRGRAAAAQPAGGASRRLPSGPDLAYRDPAAAAVDVPLSRLIDHDSFISAFRFFTEREVADVTGYRGQLDLTGPMQRALDGAWSTNRDLYLPAGLYRVRGLVLPGSAAERTRAFRLYGQGSGELFARAENGGTIVKGATGAPVLRSHMSLERSGNGNQEIAYIRFEGDADDPVVDLQTFYAQSELHHCGIYQAGPGDGIRIGYANTIEVHHNYILNRDWAKAGRSTRTGAGIRLTAVSDNGLMTLRKNTSRGFQWGISLGSPNTGVLYCARVEQCEASMCTHGIRLAETVRSSVIENCYLEGGDGGTGIHNAGNGNTISNNHVFPGFSVAIDDTEMAHATRIVGNTLSAGNARTVSPDGCTLIRTTGNGPAKLIQGNYLIADPVSFGPVERVVGLAIGGRADTVVVQANAFDPVGSWGSGPGTAKTAGLARLSATAGPGEVPDPWSAGMALSAPLLLLPHLVPSEAEDADKLVLSAGAWFDTSALEDATVREIESYEVHGGPVTLLDRLGTFRVEPGPRISLAGNRPFAGPGTLTLLLVPGRNGTHAFEISRARFAVWEDLETER